MKRLYYLAFFIPIFLWSLQISTYALEAVAKRVIPVNQVPSRQLLQNTSFEARSYRLFAGWKSWGQGYGITREQKHSGNTSIVCSAADNKSELGVNQVVELNQSLPRTKAATGWSLARDVDGIPDSNYSIYLDLEYQDGTPLWGQTGNFSTGTHNWEKRTIVFIPNKPIKRITLHAIFRWHVGTAYFDDFELRELQSPPGASSFDDVYVIPETGVPVGPTDWIEFTRKENLALQQDCSL